jgi:hypothetical protein
MVGSYLEFPFFVPNNPHYMPSEGLHRNIFLGRAEETGQVPLASTRVPHT